MFKHDQINESGFTLVEMVMVIVILGIIAATASTMLSNGFTAFLTGQNVTDADWQGRLAMERLEGDLRAVRSPSDIATATATQLIFTDMSGTSITYQLSGTTLMRNAQVLADGVGGLTFAYYDLNGSATAVLTSIRYISYSLNITQKGTNYTVATTIYPRNLI